MSRGFANLFSLFFPIILGILYENIFSALNYHTVGFYYNFYPLFSIIKKKSPLNQNKSPCAYTLFFCHSCAPIGFGSLFSSLIIIHSGNTAPAARSFPIPIFSLQPQNRHFQICKYCINRQNWNALLPRPSDSPLHLAPHIPRTLLPPFFCRFLCAFFRDFHLSRYCSAKNGLQIIADFCEQAEENKKGGIFPALN